MIEKTIVQLMPETLTDQFDFKGVYVDAEGASHSLTVYDTEYFYLNVLSQYASRKVMVPEEGAESFFLRLYNAWVNSRKNLFLKQAYAYTLKYNPVENYSSHEVMTDDTTETEYGHEIEHEHGHEIETTPSNYKDETEYPTEHKTTTAPYNTTITTTPTNDTTTHSTKGFNSNNFVETEKDVRSGSVTEATTHPGVTEETVKETFTGKTTVTRTAQTHEIVENSGKDTDTHSGTDTTTRNYTLDKTGNIGVMTPAEMLQKEFDGLMQDLAKRAMTEFIDRYTYYSEEVS